MGIFLTTPVKCAALFSYEKFNGAGPLRALTFYIFHFAVYYTYILKSKRDKKLYIGYTHDLKLRFEQHNSGSVESTKGRRPLKLIYYEACLDKEDAIKREKYLKTHHGRMFIKKRLKSYLVE